MKNIQLTLAKDIFKKDYKWLDRDFKKVELVNLHYGSTHGCIGKNGIACGTDDMDYFFEMPATAFSIMYEGKEFGIFMTEQRMEHQQFY